MDFSDTTVNNDFTLGQGSAGYHLENGRTVLDVSGGYSQLRVYDVLVYEQSVIGVLESRQTQTLGEGIWALDLSRLIAPNQRVALTAAQQLCRRCQLLPAGLRCAGSDGRAADIRCRQSVYRAQLRGGLARAGTSGPRSMSPCRYVPATIIRFGASNLGNNGLPTTTLPTNNSDFKLASVLLARQLTPTLNWDVGAYFQHQDIVDAPAVNATGGITRPALACRSARAALRLRTRFTDRRIQGQPVRRHRVLHSVRCPTSAQQETAPGLSPFSPFSTQSPPQRELDDEHRERSDRLLRPAPSCDAYAAPMERVRMARQ